MTNAPTRSGPGRLGWWEAGLAVLLLVAFVYLLAKGAGTTFYSDEWNFVLDRRDWTIGTFLEPHNEHLSLVPVAVYKALFELAGIEDYGIYRAVALLLHLTVAGLLYALVKERVGAPLGLAAAAVMLFLGAGYLDILWPFQIGFLASVAAGLGALLALERGSRRGDAVASVLLVVALASSSLGIPLAIGALAYLVAGRPFARGRLWVALGPLALYVIWYAGYGQGAFHRENLTEAPRYVANLMAAAAGGLGSLGSEWGRVLAVVFGLLVLRRLAGPLRIRPSGAMLLTAAISFWVLTALARAHLGEVETPRYIYPGALFILLIAAELARDLKPGPRAVALACVFGGAAALSGIGTVHDGATVLRGIADTVRGQLAGVEIAADTVPPDFVPDGGMPQITAGRYLSAVRDLGGSPAPSEADLATEDPVTRAAADGILLRALGVSLAPGDPAPSGSPPEAVALSGGTPTARQSCLVLSGQDLRAELRVRPGALTLEPAGAGPVTVQVRRFADAFPAAASWQAQPGQTSVLRLPPGRSERPWLVALEGPGEVTACAAAG